MPTNYDTEIINLTLLYEKYVSRKIKYEIKYKFDISTVMTYAYFKWSLQNIYHSKQ